VRTINQDINLYGKNCNATLLEFDQSDKIEWKKLWDSWNNLRVGLKKYDSRGPNLSEGLSESAFCLYNKSFKIINIKGGCDSSADTYNLQKQEAEQIKATSIASDLTSFGPTSRWDKLYFLDFYNNGNLDGSFDCYEIDTALIYNTVVNQGKNETFVDQQRQGRRPRLSLKKIIRENNITPIGSNIRVWL
jgi:hypothetical protein